MIVEHEDIRAYFENLIFSKLLAYAQNNAYEDLREKTVVANESYDGKGKKEIKIILKFLSAQNTNGVIDLPIQILVDVNTELQDIIFNILQDLAYEKNRTLDKISYFEPDLESEEENATREVIKYKFKQFYDTPIVLGTFQNNGAYKSTTLTMDMRFVIFETIATLSDMHLELTLITGAEGQTTTYAYADNSTAMKQFKDSLLQPIFHIDNRLDGRVTKGSRLQKNKYNSTNISFTLTYIMDTSSAIQQQLWELADINRKCSIKYKGSSTFTNTKNFNARIQTYTENLLVTDVTKVTVVFASTGE